MRPRSDDRSDDEVRAWYARYFQGESIVAIGASLPRPLNAAMIYYHFARLGLKLKHSNAPPSALRLSVPKPIAPNLRRPFAGPPIYRSEFIRGDAERKMRAGR